MQVLKREIFIYLFSFQNVKPSIDSKPFYFQIFSVKILVFLTMPIEPSSNDIAQQIENLWGLKSSVTCSDIVAVIVSLLESPLENLER